MIAIETEKEENEILISSNENENQKEQQFEQEKKQEKEGGEEENFSDEAVDDNSLALSILMDMFPEEKLSMAELLLIVIFLLDH